MGRSSFHDRIRFQFAAPQVEVDCRFESVSLPESSGILLGLLDHGVEHFGLSFGGSGHQSGHSAVEMLFNHPSQPLDRCQTGTDRSGSRSLQIGQLQTGELLPRHVGHPIKTLPPKVPRFGQLRVTQRGLQRLVGSSAHSVNRVPQMLGKIMFSKSHLGGGIRNVCCRRASVGRPHVHRHCLQPDQHPGRLGPVPSVEGLPTTPSAMCRTRLPALVTVTYCCRR